MAEARVFQGRIHKANIELYRLEAKYYEYIHSGIYNRDEQERICSILRVVDKLVEGKPKTALDFGAGTGNLTGKLLRMQYRVTAVDISREMCEILRMRYRNYLEDERLRVVSSKIEDATFDRKKFDLITCYSVLHHLPDYLAVIEKLSALLKKGGLMYLDHEASPFYWGQDTKYSSRIAKATYSRYCRYSDRLYFKIKGLDLPPFDCSLSDWWATKERHLDHRKIESTFRKEKFRFFTRVDYHLKKGWFRNPFFGLYRRTCEPDFSLWLARK